ncbi:NUDIX domain-containing protein [Glycomyces xiaoerkulensis]|uniref:NUDIX domain-containing protein n=1 Tax=Glycomyces xiaoerkulensis TaxID=2038139 RepID=UPI001E4AD157|nr:NUDIX hydrolase [Glycomyces xiaoerkulensis]
MHEYRVLDRELIYRGWIYELVAETVEMPGGGTARREFTDHSGAVVAVPVDAQGRVGMIRQYRVPTGEYLWELPAGLRDVEGEDPAVTARRELAEEADLRSDRLHKLGEFYTSPGISNELIHYYLATELSPVAEADLHRRVEEEAHIELVWWELDKALAAVADGQIRNGVCALALNLTRLHLEASK